MSFNRRNVNKRRSSRKFSRNVSRTKGANMRNSPMRGGWRF